MTLPNVISLDRARGPWLPEVDTAINDADSRIRAGLVELHASIAKLSDEVAELRAGVDRLAADVKIARETDKTETDETETDETETDETETDETPSRSGCDGPDGQGCDRPGCRCDCAHWDGGCEHPLTPEELARPATNMPSCRCGGCSCGFDCTCERAYASEFGGLLGAGASYAEEFGGLL